MTNSIAVEKMTLENLFLLLCPYSHENNRNYTRKRKDWTNECNGRKNDKLIHMDSCWKHKIELMLMNSSSLCSLSQGCLSEGRGIIATYNVIIKRRCYVDILNKQFLYVFIQIICAEAMLINFVVFVEINRFQLQLSIFIPK